MKVSGAGEKISSGSLTNLTKRQLPIRVVAIWCDGASKDDDLRLFPLSSCWRTVVIRELPWFAPRGAKYQPTSGESSVHAPVLIAH